MKTPRIVHVTLVVLSAAFAAVSPRGLEAQECVQIPKGAVSWWPGDGSMEDIIGGHDAQDAWGGIYSMQYSPGQVGQAFDFSDGDAAMFVPAHPDLDFSPIDDYSILLWMKSGPVNDPGGLLTLVSKWGALSSHPFPYAMRMVTRPINNPPPNAGTIWAGCYDATNYGSTATSRIFDDDVFHHVSAVFRHSEDTVEIHADGSLAAQHTYTVALGELANGDNLWFGLRASRASATAYDGLLDEIMIFDRDLSACEIAKIHSAGPAGICRGDVDSDGVPDFEDNCPEFQNAAQTDSDDDGTGDGCDCAPLNPSHSIVPPEVCALTVDRDGVISKLRWTSVSEISGDGTRYDLLRGFLDELPVGTGASEQCLENDLDALESDDGFVPASSEGVWYLVRAVSQCGQGSWGFVSSGVERISPGCP